MTKLSNEEILKIPDLLLSPDESNVLLALELLTHHPYAVRQLTAPLEVFWAFNSKQAYDEALKQIETQLPDFQFKQSPLSIIYYALQFDEIPSDYDQIQQFIQKETHYRPWLLANETKAVLYSYIAMGTALYSDLWEQAIAHHHLALQYAPNQFKSALNYIHTLKDRRPSQVRLRDCQAEIIAHYNKAYALNPKEWVLYDLALFYQNDLRDIEQTKKAWKRCLDLPSISAKTCFAIASFYAEQKDWAFAKKLAQQSAAQNTGSGYIDLDKVYFLLGTIERIGFNNLIQAETHYIQALAENEFYMDPLEALMELSLENNDYAKAIKWHKVALNDQPFNVPLMQTIGDLYLEIYDLEEASRYYTEILDLNANYSPALEGLKRIQQL